MEKFDTAREDLACWVNNTTHMQSEYVILIASPLQQWLHERATFLPLYVHCLSCFVLIVSYIVPYIMTSDLGKLPVCLRGLARDGCTGHNSYPRRGWEAEDCRSILQTGICPSWVDTCCAFVYRLTQECRGATLLYYSPREYAIKKLITINISPVCAVKAYRIRSIAPLILNFGTRRRMVSFAAALPPERTPVLAEQEVGWIPDMVWTF